MVGLCGEFDSPALPGSDAPSGICTVRRGPLGREAPPGPPIFKLLDLDGGVKELSAPEETDVARVLSRLFCVLDRFSCGEVDGPPRDETSTDCDRFDSALTPWDSVVNEARCCDRMDRFSSMGVNILCDFL